MIMFRNACLLATFLVLGACATPRPVKPVRAPASPATANTAKPSPEILSVLRLAQSKVDEAKKLLGNWAEADQLMATARAAANQGNNPRAQSLAQEARSRAEVALDGQYVTLSAQKLQELYSVTGLSDDQLARMRAAEVALLRGEGRSAYALLNTLSTEIKSDKNHAVKSGDSLWSISAKPEVYANPYLWPLIWDANKGKIKDPNMLHIGQVLKIKPNPTVDEVVQAVNFARSHLGPKVKIGPVQEARE